MAEFALRSLEANGIEVVLNTRAIYPSSSSIKLNNGSSISSHSLIWAAGVKPDPLVTKIVECEHDQKSGKIIANNHLELKGWNNVFALGDCAQITDPETGKPSPPTAQHAIRQARVAANNIISKIQKRTSPSSSVEKKSSERQLEKFDYKTKGIMALIGKRNGVGVVLEYNIHGILAWWVWRMYYLGNLPTIEKRFRVLMDWIVDMLFKRDVTRLRVVSENKRFLLNGTAESEKSDKSIRMAST